MTYTLVLLVVLLFSLENKRQGATAFQIHRFQSSFKLNTPLFASRASSSKSNRENPRNKIKSAKVARVLRDELSDIICTCDIKAPVYPNEELLKTVSIVDIELSPDFSVAKVYITVSGNSVEKRQIYVWLSENVGQVRHTLCKRLRTLRRVPNVSFSLADTQASFYLNDIIDEFAEPDDFDEDDIDFEEM